MQTAQALRQWLFRFGPDTHLPVILTQRRIFILPTATGLLYGMVLVVMLLGAINYSLSLGHGLVFLLAGLGFVAMVHTFRNLIALQIFPGRADPVFAGETAKFRILLVNPRDHDRRAVEFSFSGQSGNAAGACLNLLSHTRTVVEIPCETTHRGRLDPGRITLSTRYPLGLFRAWSYPHPPLSCLVYPEPLEMPLPPHTAVSQGGQRPGELGLEDFSGLRLRQPNDSPRHIAWKAVARDIDNRPLLVKQFAGGTEGQLVLDWALIPADYSTETRLSILCGWILAAEERHLNFGLRLPGIDLDPAQGPSHRDACLEALALYGEAP